MGEKGRREGGEKPEKYPKTTKWGKRRVERRQYRSRAEDNTHRGTPECYHGEDAITGGARKYHNMAEYMEEQL